MSKMFEQIKDWFNKNTWNVDRVKRAVELGNITAKEFEEITEMKHKKAVHL